MTLFRANFRNKKAPVIKEPEPIEVERDRTPELISIVETVFEAAKEGASLEELKAWVAEVWADG